MVSAKQKEVDGATRARILDLIRGGKSPVAAARSNEVTPRRLQALLDEDDNFAEGVELAVAEAETAKAKAKAKGKPSMLPIPPPPRAPPPPIPSAPAPDLEPWAARWVRVRKEAALLGKGEIGQLRWVEKQCVAAGLHALDPYWLWHFESFYASGKKVDVGRCGLRAAKSDSCSRAIVAEVLLSPRLLEPNIVGVCPVMSQNMREADDRFDTIVGILSACGLTDLTGQRIKDEHGQGFSRAGGGTNARVISLRDADNHLVEFRIYPASVSGAAGFTGIAGFCDEVDLWGKEQGANPAKRVFDILYARFLTQPFAKLHVMSASYNAESHHAKMVSEGDTELQRVARLGEAGALKDTEARAAFAVSIKSTDPILLLPSHASSVDIPSWVSNPIAPIEECFKMARGDLKKMVYLYGGRVNPNAGRAISTSLEEIQAIGEMNRKVAARTAERGELMKFDGLPSWDPRSRRQGPNGRGDQSI